MIRIQLTNRGREGDVWSINLNFTRDSIDYGLDTGPGLDRRDRDGNRRFAINDCVFAKQDNFSGSSSSKSRHGSVKVKYHQDAE